VQFDSSAAWKSSFSDLVARCGPGLVVVMRLHVEIVNPTQLVSGTGQRPTMGAPAASEEGPAVVSERYLSARKPDDTAYRARLIIIIRILRLYSTVSILAKARRSVNGHAPSIACRHVLCCPSVNKRGACKSSSPTRGTRENMGGRATAGPHETPGGATSRQSEDQRDLFLSAICQPQ